ncbi:hypothetical protein SEUCBS140593_001511 [Sporothrix eucalyptigena]|uniref:Uncharacterized protein n=1 Tax=Sporothrix eucalyptigena TaxID=1812306 RepID=A0ABP0AYW3_9PEZI
MALPTLDVGTHADANTSNPDLKGAHVVSSQDVSQDGSPELPTDLYGDGETSRTNYIAGRGRVQRKWYAWFADTDTSAER